MNEHGCIDLAQFGGWQCVTVVDHCCCSKLLSG